MSKDNLPYVLSVVFRVFVVFSVAWNWHPRLINRIYFWKNAEYCTQSGGFPVIRVICHESVIYVTVYVSHGSKAQGLLTRIARQSETFLMATR